MRGLYGNTATKASRKLNGYYKGGLMDIEKSIPDVRRWTKAAVYCYRRGCVCDGCYYKNVLETECSMKLSVLKLYRVLGEPQDVRTIRMRKKQLKIINHYGFEAQKEKLKEEMTELAYARDEDNYIEEIADVLNVIQGIVAYKGWEAKITELQEQKLDRQIDRIHREKYKKEDK